jgi:hypothetical protein
VASMVLSGEDFGSLEYRQWQRQYATIRIQETLALGLAFDLDGLRLQGGWSPRSGGAQALSASGSLTRAAVTNSWM